MGAQASPVLNPPPTSLPMPSPLGCPSAPPLSALFHAANLDWQSISHMVMYMFQCSSLKSSHPCLLPQSPKVCSLYLCLFCCLAYRVIISIFVNYIYMCYYTVLMFFFLTYFTPRGRCFYRRGKWSSERLNNVPKIIDLVPVELNVEPRLFDSWNYSVLFFSLSVKTWHYHWQKKKKLVFILKLHKYEWFVSLAIALTLQKKKIQFKPHIL